jgi:hypothetical protein
MTQYTTWTYNVTHGTNPRSDPDAAAVDITHP